MAEEPGHWENNYLRRQTPAAPYTSESVPRAPRPGDDPILFQQRLDQVRAREAADPPPEDRTGDEWLAWVKRQIDAGAACTMPDGT